MIEKRDITGLVLCGGAGRRLGGIDKPLVSWNGRSLIAHVLERVAPHCTTVLISANRSRAAYEALGFPVIQDRLMDAGPLGGVHAAAPLVGTPFLFICAGDMPTMDPHLIGRLADAFHPEVEAVVAHDGEQLQPLVMLLRRSALDGLNAFLHAGGRAVHAWLATLQTGTVDASDLASSFFNVNTPGDLGTDDVG